MHHLPIPVEEALSRYAATEGLSRENAMERILRNWLTNHGFLHAAQTESQHPEDLNASNDD